VDDPEEAPDDNAGIVAEGRAQKVAKTRKVRAKRRQAVQRAPSDSGRSSGQATPATKDLEMEATPSSASKDKVDDSAVVPTPKPETMVHLAEVEVLASQSADPAVDELKTIFKRISRANASVCILELHGWLKRHPKHRKRMDARYAMGYCEFQRGNLRAANRIFANLPKGNRWIRKVGDYLNPPKPH
jgi:TolA-binding protein